jgi:hypothetical protein
MRFLPHDRDSKFSRAFDEVFKPRASRSSAPRSAEPERVRRALDRNDPPRLTGLLLITSRRQLEHVLRFYVEHYSRHRPHRALDLALPIPKLASNASARTRQTSSGRKQSCQARPLCNTAPMSLVPTGSRPSRAAVTFARFVCSAWTTRTVALAARTQVSVLREWLRGGA